LLRSCPWGLPSDSQIWYANSRTRFSLRFMVVSPCIDLGVMGYSRIVFYVEQVDRKLRQHLRHGQRALTGLDGGRKNAGQFTGWCVTQGVRQQDAGIAPAGRVRQGRRLGAQQPGHQTWRHTDHIFSAVAAAEGDYTSRL